MGGSPNAEPFKYYVNETIKGFLALRKYHEHIYNLVLPMMQYISFIFIFIFYRSSLPCFRANSMENLTERFVLAKNDLEAATYMKYVIMDAYDKFTTLIYDGI